MSETNGLPIIKVYLCQPYSDKIEPEASDSREYAAEGWEHICAHLGHLKLRTQTIKSSMLCESFNGGVTNAKRDKVDVFAMIHSDMQAGPGWLCQLVRDLYASDADILNAVACIKDERYLTSNAIAYTDDPYDRKRRLSLRECYQLPEIFTLDDIQQTIDPEAKALLPNPGLIVMRVRDWFYKWPGFSTMSCVEETPDGDYRAREISEDWLLGYYAKQHGVKVAATRRVFTDHIGRKKYSTRRPQGMDCDREYFQAIGQPPVGPGKWVFPGEVDGWLTSVEGVGLAKLATGKRVLEIGSYCGRSTICMAQTAQHIVAVDPHDARGTPHQGDSTLLRMMQNLVRYKVQNVTIEKATSTDFAASYDGPKFDVAFIDGAHDYESVTQDLDVALSLLGEGGLIAFHDYRRVPREHDGGWDEGVTQAVNEYLGAGAELVERCGTVAIIRPIAAEVA